MTAKIFMTCDEILEIGHKLKQGKSVAVVVAETGFTTTMVRNVRDTMTDLPKLIRKKRTKPMVRKSKYA